jgi:hypothetical protein
VVELVDTGDLKSPGLAAVPVQVRSSVMLFDLSSLLVFPACFFTHSRYNKSMKNRILSLMLLITLLSFGQEVTENMKTLFYSYENDAQRLELINTHLDEGGSLGDFASEAFLSVTREGDPATDNMRDVRMELQKVLLQNISGTLGLELNEAILDLYSRNDDPLLRGEIYQTWGRTKADGPWETLLSRILELVNSQQRSKAEEIEAYAAVLALEEYQRDESFPHLILIQRGWFTPQSDVRERAFEVLEAWPGNGKDALVEAARDWENLSQVETFVEAGFRRFPQADWTEFALIAFIYGMDRQYIDRESFRTQNRLIDLALSKINQANLDDERLFPYYQLITNKRTDLNRTLSALQALGNNVSTRAVDQLILLLDGFNTQMSLTGLSREEESMVLGILSAMEAKKDGAFVNVISEMRFSGYRTTVLRESQRILRNLQ